MSNFIEIEGKKVHVADMNPCGGSPVIMIHGLFTNLSVFYFHIARRVAKHRRVILYDLRGHGLSEPRDGVFSMESLAGDLRGLMGALGLPRVSLAGYSFGGATALYTALRYPELVESLALIDAPLFSEKIFDMYRLEGPQLDEAFEHGLKDYIRSVGAPVSGAGAASARKLFRQLFDQNSLGEGFKEGREFFMSKEGAAERVKAPALLLYGKHSPYLETGRSLARRIPGARFKSAWGDHNLPVTRGAWAGRKLAGFFGEAGGCSLASLPTFAGIARASDMAADKAGQRKITY